jgi:hypothetical protein
MTGKKEATALGPLSPTRSMMMRARRLATIVLLATLCSCEVWLGFDSKGIYTFTESEACAANSTTCVSPSDWTKLSPYYEVPNVSLTVDVDCGAADGLPRLLLTTHDLEDCSDAGAQTFSSTWDPYCLDHTNAEFALPCGRLLAIPCALDRCFSGSCVGGCGTLPCLLRTSDGCLYLDWRFNENCPNYCSSTSATSNASSVVVVHGSSDPSASVGDGAVRWAESGVAACAAAIVINWAAR